MNNFPKTENFDNMIPLKRTRAKRSCDFCRKRKARCDADHRVPCSNCKAWGYTCEFLTVCRKRGPPSVYVKNLEMKCKKMELLLSSITKLPIQEIVKKNYCLDSNTSIPTKSVEDIEDDVACGIAEENKTKQNYINIEDTVNNLNVQDYDSLKYTGQSACFQLLDRSLFTSKNILHLPGREDVVFKLTPENELLVIRSGQGKTRLDVGLSINSSIFDENKGIQTTINSSKITLPSEKLIEKAFQIYFTHIHTFLPLLNQVRFETHDKKSSNILSYAVLAVSFRFAAHHFPKIFNTKKANFYAETYYQKVSARLKDPHRTSLCHVQAALLLTLYLDMEETDVESLQWFTLGRAIRMSQDIGLHRSCANWNLPPSEIETRHRVFYSCYILDRLMGARLGKPLTILDCDFDTDLPKAYEVNDDNQVGPPIYQSFVCLIKLVEIYGRVLKELYAPKSKQSNSIADLDDPTILAVLNRRLMNWKKTLDCTEIGQAQKVNLLLFYFTSMVLLHQRFLKNSSESLIACENAALNISAIVRQKQMLMADPNSYAPLCLPTCFVYSMFQSCLVHLAIVIQNTKSSRRLGSLKQSIALLQQYENLVSARRACNILFMLVNINRIHLDNIQDKSHDSQSPASSKVDYFDQSVQQIEDITFEDDEQMPKSPWYMRMMNTNIVEGIRQDMYLPYPPQHQEYDIKTPLPTPYLPQYTCIPTTSSSSAASIYSIPSQPSNLNWNEWGAYLNQQQHSSKPYPIYQ